MMEVSRPPEYARTTLLDIRTPLRLAALTAHQRQHDRLLNMQTLLRLIENHGSRRVNDRRFDFFSAMRGQAMHEQRIRRCMRHKFLVHLERQEYSTALLGFVFLTHAGP